MLPQNRSFDSVWSKIGTLQDCIVLCKSAATPLPTLWFLTTNKSFQMRYCMNFYFKWHKNYKNINLKFVFWSLKPYLLIILKTFKVKIHAVSFLIAPTVVMTGHRGVVTFLRLEGSKLKNSFWALLRAKYWGAQPYFYLSQSQILGGPAPPPWPIVRLRP